MDALGVERLAVVLDVGIRVLQAPAQPLELQRLQLVAAGALDRLELAREAVASHVMRTPSPRITVRPLRLCERPRTRATRRAVLVGDDDVVDPGAAGCARSPTRSAVSTSPPCAGARKSTVSPAATVTTLRELQAKANAESASVVMKPPWQMSKPLSMSSRTVIVRVAVPAPRRDDRHAERLARRGRRRTCARRRHGRRAETAAASIGSAIGEDRRTLGHERGHALEIVVRSRRARVCSAASWLSAAAKSSCCEASIAARVAASARVGIATSRCATARDLGLEHAASSTHFQIRPSRSASSAESLSPSIARPSARARPTSRGSSQVPPQSGTRPILAKAWMKLAERAAIDHVAAEREVGAGAGGDAVDRGDHRHRHRAHPQRQRLVEALDRGADVGRLAAGLEVGRDRRIGEVLAGAEAAAAAGERRRSGPPRSTPRRRGRRQARRASPR